MSIPKVTKKRTAFTAPSDDIPLLPKPDPSLEDKIILDENEQDELIQAFRLENEKMNEYYQTVLTAVSIVISILFFLHALHLLFTSNSPANMLSKYLLLSPVLSSISTAATPFIYRTYWSQITSSPSPTLRTPPLTIFALLLFSLLPPLIAYLTTAPIQEPDIAWYMSAEWWMTRGLWWEPVAWVGVHETMVRSGDEVERQVEGLENAKYKLKGA
ncbi:hypothetical protein HDV00_003315 [Rhizophlyctis rosea]|nr:hypothetical protein HDV00_003315 [Rhizophlyctis rosea]